MPSKLLCDYHVNTMPEDPDNVIRFAMVLIPVYEDPDDAKSSPFALSNVEPFTWQWLSTINRVNSQVQKVCVLVGFLQFVVFISYTKTLVLSYVTIPALSKLPVGELSSPACSIRYVIREVVIRRFVPARMRD